MEAATPAPVATPESAPRATFAEEPPAAQPAESAPAAYRSGGALAFDVDGLGIKYNQRFTRKTTLRESFAHLARRGTPREKSFWALRDVSFRLTNGESLAVIGPNGAGKSTLLQVLAGILMPSEGSIVVHGRISSLLTLGAGFDPDLTGRENVRLAGAFLGMSKAEVEERLEPMIAFADIGEFIDAPIRTYSAGMRARLGFSIATAVDPDVLLLDEVLATGDQVFRAKSKARVLELVQAAKAIVLVTHDMQWVTEYCNRAVLIEKGRVVAEGDPADVVAIHQDHSQKAREEQLAQINRYGGVAPRGRR
jgi:ABC-type polysaccharide/polyol phosphate transport system ATPase subunit